MTDVPPALRAVLEAAQRAGMLGPEDVAVPVAHALEFFRALPDPGDARCLDLGSGAGVPGLPLALHHPRTRWTLVDAWEARCAHLEHAVRELGLGDRVDVQHGRAEELARTSLRAAFDRVVVRSFGPPAITAECAAPFVREGGLLIVSVAREAVWPDTIGELGLALGQSWSSERGAFRCYRRTGALDDRFPRRTAAQRRRPLF